MKPVVNEQPFPRQILLQMLSVLLDYQRQDIRTEQDKLELGKPSSWPSASGDPG